MSQSQLSQRTSGKTEITVIANAVKQSSALKQPQAAQFLHAQTLPLDCFVALAPRNDENKKAQKNRPANCLSLGHDQVAGTPLILQDLTPIK